MTERDLFLAALDIEDPGERLRFLTEKCGTDKEKLNRLQQLLLAKSAAGSFLEMPAQGMATPDQINTIDDPAAQELNRPARHDETEGATIGGRYKLRQRIGEGGMGTVWMADQTEPVKRKVAIKLIRVDRGQSKTILARFEAERQAIALMDHPNIARLLDAGTTESGMPFFVMELVKGIPLNDFCDTRKLTIPERLNLFVQICLAVQHAHQKGIIHRDLKPSNILVESHDGKPLPKVIDFGLAKATKGLQLTDESLFTAFGSVLGTPLYMAPEQATFNAVDVDTRSDVYALGVILFELLTGTTPITRDSLKKAALDELLKLIRDQDPPTPSSRLGSSNSGPSVAANRQIEPARLGRFVKGDLDWIVMKAIAKERERRYETANGFAQDIQRFLNHEPVTAGPPSATYRFKKFVRRNRLQVISAGLVLLALLAGLVGTTLGLLRAEAALEREENQKQLAIEAGDREIRQRKIVENQLAGQLLDRAIETYQDPRIAGQPGRLVRLAEAMADIPASATAHRQLLARRLLLDLGSLIAPGGGATTARYRAGPLLVKHDPPEEGRPLVFQIVDRQTRKVLRHITHNGPVARVEVTANGGTLIVLSRYDAKGEFVGYNLATGETQWKCPYPAPDPDHQPLHGASGSGTSSVFSGDGSRLIIIREKRLAAFGKVLKSTYRTELWDTGSAKRIVEFPDREFLLFASVNPTGQSIHLRRHGFNSEEKTKTTQEIRALDDGHLLGRLEYSPQEMTPDGKCLVQYDREEVRWIDPGDGRVLGICRYDQVVPREWHRKSPGFTPAIELKALSEDWAILQSTSLSVEEPKLSVVASRWNGRAVAIQDEVIAGDQDGLLLASGRLYALESGRFLKPPTDRQFHPEARRFAFKGRHLLHPDSRIRFHLPAKMSFNNSTQDSIPGTRFNPTIWQVFDLAADRSLHLTSGIFAKDPGPLSLSFQGNAIDGNRLWADPSGNTPPLPDDSVDFDPKDFRRFACLIELGDFDDAGVFRLWSLPEWVSKFTEFHRELRPTPGFPFAELISTDHWAATYPIDELADDLERLNALNAIIKNYPNYGFAYIRRAEFHLSQGRPEDALQDFRAAKRLGISLRPSQTVIPTFLRDPDLPRKTLDEFAILFDLSTQFGERRGSLAEIVLSYRRGDYHAALGELDRIPENAVEVPYPLESLEQICHIFIAINSPPSLLTPLIYLPRTTRLQGQDHRYRSDEALACLCLFRLGKTEEAKARWAKSDRIPIHFKVRAHQGPDFFRELKSVLGVN